MTATERLTSALETQMDLIEKDSNVLEDHVAYWEAVRKEHTLKCAARKKGLQRIGPYACPPCSVSSTLAKQAIQMHMMCSDLCSTQWANDCWTLPDCSWDRFNSTPPNDCFKKNASVIEVIFDGDAGNRAWYTLWDFVLIPTEDGWYKTTCAADHAGCFYKDMFGHRVYYQSFKADAQRYSETGRWQVLNQHSVISSSTDEVVCVDGVPERPASCSGGADTGQQPSPPRGHTPPFGAQPDFGVGSTTNDANSRDCRSGSGPRRSLWTAGGARDRQLGLARSRTEAAVPSSVVEVSPRGQEETPTPVESSEAEAVEPALLSATGKQYCLLLTGSVNVVKCFRYSCQNRHRRKYKNCTTTVQMVGTGKERLGGAMMIMTFEGSVHREKFLAGVTIPSKLRMQKFVTEAE